jgi:TonB family protein
VNSIFKREGIMKQVIFLICLGILAGCSVTQNNELSNLQPELIQQTRLPAIPESITSPEIKLEVNVMIDKTGSVVDAKFVKGIGNRQWDALAVDSIKQWKYLPAELNGKPVTTTRKEIVIVKTGNPIYMSLAMVEFDSLDIADSAYDLLNEGETLRDVVSRYSYGITQGRETLVGNHVDISIYPEEVRSELAKLDENEFTEPLVYGRKFVIFKRLADPAAL